MTTAIVVDLAIATMGSLVCVLSATASIATTALPTSAAIAMTARIVSLLLAGMGVG
jgi:hypothetical protein